MPVLDCSVTNCYYNKEKMCCRGGINVEGEDAEVKDATACGSFRERKDDGYSNNCKCEEPPEQRSDIDCEAEKCMFNQECKCMADHIQIHGSGATCTSETMCASFNR